MASGYPLEANVTHLDATEPPPARAGAPAPRPNDCRILLLNPPHTAIGSRVPKEKLPPLGLLAIGGPLLDAGFPVQLLDAEFGPLSDEEIISQVVAAAPRILMTGHAGSSSAHPTIARLARRIKAALPDVTIVYGGVYPTFHWRAVLVECPEIDYIVRGEGEQAAVALARAICAGDNVMGISGFAFRGKFGPQTTGRAKPIEDLDNCRVGWELIDHARYSYWGDRRAVVVQFSRGCHHRCTYCGQRSFWGPWRHRDPVRFAAELARLHREHGVQVINFADELPTGDRDAWRAFLEALIAENVPLTLVGSTRADDIVRDADILHLYRRAGVVRFLLGIESYDEATLAMIRKGTRMADDREAIRLLRRHGIISLATYAVGFGEERDRDFLRSLRQLLDYDPDQIQMLYATPHHWTPFARSAAQREVVQPDLRRWDYKHQVLATRHLAPWRVFLWVKFIEVALQARPRALARTYLSRDAEYAHGMRWYVRIGRKVWFHELADFLFGSRPAATGLTLSGFLARRDAMPAGQAHPLPAT